MKITPILLAALLLAPQANEARASTITARTASKLVPKHDANSIYEALSKAAQAGSYCEINKVIKLADKHDLKLDHLDLSWILLDVAASGNLEAIDLLVKYADELDHNHHHFNNFGRMIRKTTQYGHLKATDLVIKLADKHRIEIPADDFTMAIAYAANNGETKAINHTYTIATKREVSFDAERFGGKVLSEAASSSHPKAIALVNKIAIEQEIKIKDKHWGWAMQTAANNSEALEQMFKIITEQGVKLQNKYYVETLARAAKHHYETAELEIEVADKTIELVVDFAAEQGIKFAADDFGLAMARATKYGNTEGMRKVVELAIDHGVILNRKYFVEAIQAAMPNHYRRLEQATDIANEYGINFTADDFVATMLEARDLTGYHDKALRAVGDFALKYGVKFEKEHLSLLLYKATLYYGKGVEAVIEITALHGIEIDAEYFSKAIAHPLEGYNFRVVRELNELAIDHGVRLKPENF